MRGVTYIEDIFFRSWWVIFFILLCLMVYEQGVKKRNEDFETLKKQLTVLEMEKHQLEEEQEDLLLQINSQNDPAWIEITLMKILGLVPEGYKKVLFVPHPGKR